MICKVIFEICLKITHAFFVKYDGVRMELYLTVKKLIIMHLLNVKGQKEQSFGHSGIPKHTFVYVFICILFISPYILTNIYIYLFINISATLAFIMPKRLMMYLLSWTWTREKILFISAL